MQFFDGGWVLQFGITITKSNAFYKLYSNKFYFLCTASSGKSGENQRGEASSCRRRLNKKPWVKPRAKYIEIPGRKASKHTPGTSWQQKCGTRRQGFILYGTRIVASSLRLRSGQACRRRLNKGPAINCGANYKDNPAHRWRG